MSGKEELVCTISWAEVDILKSLSPGQEKAAAVSENTMRVRNRPTAKGVVIKDCRSILNRVVNDHDLMENMKRLVGRTRQQGECDARGGDLQAHRVLDHGRSHWSLGGRAFSERAVTLEISVLARTCQSLVRVTSNVTSR